MTINVTDRKYGCVKIIYVLCRADQCYLPLLLLTHSTEVMTDYQLALVLLVHCVY